MMSKKIIPVFFNTDNNFTVPTYISLFSLLHNYRGTSEIYAFILTSDVFSDENSRLLNSLSERFQKVKIRIINTKDSYNSVSFSINYVSYAALYRLMIPRITDSLSEIEIDRCLYLDSDLVVEGDISELFDTDSNGCFVCGVGDLLQLSEERNARKDLLGIPSMDRYINSGVLLMNLGEINRVNGLRERLETAGYREDFPYIDQDAINSVLYEGIRLLPLKYNVMTRDIYRNDKTFYQLYGKKNIQEARKSPVIVHYISDKKPWLYITTVMARKWWKYIWMQDKKTWMEYIKPFLKTHKVPLYKRAKETVKTILKKLGVYYLIIGRIR